MSTNGNEYKGAQSAQLTEKGELRQKVEEFVNKTPVTDIHTHLFSPEFGKMNLFGIDELLTYHYLIAEMFRSADIAPEKFWHLNKREQANLIWKTLFVDNTPISEAARGVITVLNSFGLDTNAVDLTEARKFFQTQNVYEHIDSVFEMAKVKSVVMTNDPFDPDESEIWESGISIDKRFQAALRTDALLNNWKTTAAILEILGSRVDINLTEDTITTLRNFMDKRIARMKPLYMAVSLPDSFKYPDDDVRNRLIRDVVLTTAREHKLPFALMVGVRRAVNPALKWAGDGVGKADVSALERMCAENPDVRFLATFLSRENQHELCVSARKFNNLMPFGCWWFLNNPSIVYEITRERIELLGTSFIPQHSDARILEQLVYKWQHSRRVIADALYDSYEQLLTSGRAVRVEEIERDVKRMFSDNFDSWVNLTAKQHDAEMSEDEKMAITY